MRRRRRGEGKEDQEKKECKGPDLCLWRGWGKKLRTERSRGQRNVGSKDEAPSE